MFTPGLTQKPGKAPPSLFRTHRALTPIFNPSLIKGEGSHRRQPCLEAKAGTCDEFVAILAPAPYTLPFLLYREGRFGRS